MKKIAHGTKLSSDNLAEINLRAKDVLAHFDNDALNINEHGERVCHEI
jgi:hypothetical protein